MNKKMLAVLAVPAVLAGVGTAALAACGGSGPPNATSIVQGDGYTPISLAALGGSATDIANSLPTGDVSSLAVGVSTANSSEYQFVAVLTAQGQSDVTSTGNVASEESTVDASGATMTYANGVVIITGTPGQFNNMGN